jgi:hypothetical protein
MTQVRRTSLPSSRRPSMIGRWLAVAAVAASLVPAAALGSSPDPPRGIMGPTNHVPGPGPAHRTANELAQRVEAPPTANPDDGFSWADAGIGAGAVAGLAALAGVGYSVRRRTHAAPRPAV